MWKLFKRSQTSAKTCSSDIPEDEWVKHYSAVFGSKDPSLEQDCDKCLDEKLKTLLKVRNTFVISKSAVVKISSKLKRGKAPGLDGICPDNLQHGTDLIFEHVSLLL